MSSPLGGFYISSINRDKQKKFDLSSRVRVLLDITLEGDGQVLIAQNRCFYVEETQTLITDNASITVDSAFLDSDRLSSSSKSSSSRNSAPTTSSLLNLKCQIKCRLNGEAFNGQQEVNLSPCEPLSCLVNANERLKITLLVKPI